MVISLARKRVVQFYDYERLGFDRCDIVRNRAEQENESIWIVRLTRH